MPLRNEAGKLVRVHDAEILQIEAWGAHGLRVRATQRAEIDAAARLGPASPRRRSWRR